MLAYPGSYLSGSVVLLYILGDTLVIASLSKTKVFTTAKPHPSQNALFIIGYEVVGGAEAKPKGLGKLTPRILILRSMLSISVVQDGR
ncbi:unnamed protein product [Paramecium octaurelia]|uniref:Uncharacterized protein n=1 Tax=Paramecium octaurelia TaxID=43137 RepID=A0A8S1T722_PAROT|nr:unnamed protein product [Paramecium octaurelia]